MNMFSLEPLLLLLYYCSSFSKNIESKKSNLLLLLLEQAPVSMVCMVWKVQVPSS